MPAMTIPRLRTLIREASAGIRRASDHAITAATIQERQDWMKALRNCIAIRSDLIQRLEAAHRVAR